MTTHDDIAERWVAVQEGKASRLIGSSSSFIARHDRIESYGSHFPLVIPIRETAGNRDIVFYLLNGDRYSVSTTRHQSIVRDALRGASSPSLIVPFTAIDAAGIVRDTIRPVDIRPDRTEPITWRCSAPHTHTYDEHGEWAASFECAGNASHVRREHFLGDAVFTADVRTRNGGQTVTRSGVRFVSSFDVQEPRPLYFLAELPADSWAQTVTEALHALRPGYVRQADSDGREVTRQGDMFAVAPPLAATRAGLREAGAVFAKRVSLFGTAHTATEVATLPNGVVFGLGQLRHEPGVIGESWRERDHVRRPILDGKTWARIMPNTVPRGTNGALGTLDVSAPRAWTISGKVD